MKTVLVQGKLEGACAIHDLEWPDALDRVLKGMVDTVGITCCTPCIVRVRDGLREKLQAEGKL